MSIINPVVNSTLVSGAKQVYQQGKTITVQFSSNTTLYNPRVSIFSEVNEIPTHPRTTSIDGTPSIMGQVGGPSFSDPVELIYEDGIIQPKMMQNDMMFPDPNQWRQSMMIRSYFGDQGYWEQLCTMDVSLDGADRDYHYTDDPGAVLAWSNSGNSIRVSMNFALSDLTHIINGKRVYFKFEFDCDDHSNHTHTKWGVLSLDADPVTDMIITWTVV